VEEQMNLGIWNESHKKMKKRGDLIIAREAVVFEVGELYCDDAVDLIEHCDAYCIDYHGHN